MDENYSKGADFCGPNETVRSNDTWRMKGLDLETAPSPVSNGFDLTFERFSAATLDLARMGISVTSPMTATITGDGTATLALTGPWADGTEVVIERSGSTPLAGGAAESWTVVASDGVVALAQDFAGAHSYKLTAK